MEKGSAQTTLEYLIIVAAVVAAIIAAKNLLSLRFRSSYEHMANLIERSVR